VKPHRSPKLPTRADISWRDQLTFYPIPNAAAEVDVQQGGIMVRVPNKKMRSSWRLLVWFARPPSHRRVWLEGAGIEVWELCDGQRDVEAVVDAFAAANSLTFHEARISVAQFLADLGKRGLIALVSK